MSQASGLQRPLFLILLLLIDVVQLSFFAKAMRPYPTFTPPQSWTQFSQQHSHYWPAAAALSSSSHQPRDISASSLSHPQDNSRKLDSANNHEVFSHQSLNCGGAASSSSSRTDCARSPAPEEAAGSEIDPRYGVEKRLVPTGPNPLHN